MNADTGDIDYTFRHYLVAFLDILNQREKIREIKSLPANEPEFEVFLNDVRQTLGTVLRFRKFFNNFFKSFSQDRPMPEGLSPDDEKNFLS